VNFRASNPKAETTSMARLAADLVRAGFGDHVLASAPEIVLSKAFCQDRLLRHQVRYERACLKATKGLAGPNYHWFGLEVFDDACKSTNLDGYLEPSHQRALALALMLTAEKCDALEFMFAMPQSNWCEGIGAAPYWETSARGTAIVRGSTFAEAEERLMHAMAHSYDNGYVDIGQVENQAETFRNCCGGLTYGSAHRRVTTGDNDPNGRRATRTRPLAISQRRGLFKAIAKNPKAIRPLIFVTPSW
jgi:hypothetical protein